MIFTHEHPKAFHGIEMIEVGRPGWFWMTEVPEVMYAPPEGSVDIEVDDGALFRVLDRVAAVYDGSHLSEDQQDWYRRALGSDLPGTFTPHNAWHWHHGISRIKRMYEQGEWPALVDDNPAQYLLAWSAMREAWALHDKDPITDETKWTAQCLAREAARHW